ncbi:Lrp/AsnC family transcriptional regulator [Hazenella sp. IB182357]|uniref:Lrp/AsnC family transcriptional regulator n=1 Tax=Polycladospora coralii TaxID=2771432 RepID=A0A926N991_9BACL|nr:Lrp/AsnC family transcriptional regulator [Polycladospora coralii]MBD1372516.1 Lrp/AsnC family transcriptional regulator [Polycladospora coralii]MBS7531361.1 Lrp/AsnC family transcriptional regulator [Polycladospora coralii]
MKMDEIDGLIVHELKQNSRLSMRELAKKVNLSAPSVAERVKKLEIEGVIKGYSVVLDQAKMGSPVQVLMEVTVRNGAYDAFRRELSRRNEIEFAYRVAGKACFFLKINLASLEELEKFIDEVRAQVMTESYIILSQVK